MAGPDRIFISYAHRDGAELAVGFATTSRQETMSSGWMRIASIERNKLVAEDLRSVQSVFWYSGSD
jgi:hypothetical protein